MTEEEILQLSLEKRKWRQDYTEDKTELEELEEKIA